MRPSTRNCWNGVVPEGKNGMVSSEVVPESAPQSYVKALIAVF